MKRTRKAAVVLFVAALLMVLTSCDGIFENSLLQDFTRDQGNMAAELAKKDTSELASTAAAVEDKAQAESVVSALSIKAKEDPEKFVEELEPEDKIAIINAATTAVLDVSSIGASLMDVMDKNKNNSGDDPDPSSGEEPGNDDDEKEMAIQVVNTIIDSIGNADTSCVEIILNDALAEDSEGVPVLKDTVTEDEKASLCMGAVTVAASAVSGILSSDDGEENKTDELIEKLTNPDSDIDDLDGFLDSLFEDEVGDGGELPPEVQASKDKLETSLKTIYALSNSGFDFSQLLSGGNKSSGDDSGSGEGNNPGGLGL